MNFNEAQSILREHGQEHLLQYYDELTKQQQESLLSQIENINFSAFHALDASGERKIGNLAPVPAVTAAEIESNREEFENAGLAAIRAGKVAAAALALQTLLDEIDYAWQEE